MATMSPFLPLSYFRPFSAILLLKPYTEPSTILLGEQFIPMANHNIDINCIHGNDKQYAAKPIDRAPKRADNVRVFPLCKIESRSDESSYHEQVYGNKATADESGNDHI